jgi:nicotinamide-nucleotide amidase
VTRSPGHSADQPDGASRPTAAEPTAAGLETAGAGAAGAGAAGAGAAGAGAAGLETASPRTAAGLAVGLIGLLTGAGQTVAVAESLTGGLVAAALTSVPGSSLAFRGGIVAYATSLKNVLLGVPAELLAAHGPVHPEVAALMARNVAARLDATFGLATTGVAGPGPADGKPAGTVFVALAGPGRTTVSELHLTGTRNEVRDASVQAALSLLASMLREDIS